MQVLMKIFSKKTQNKGLVLIIKESDNTMSLQSAIDKKLHLLYIYGSYGRNGRNVVGRAGYGYVI